jgi:hypothetical protein
LRKRNASSEAKTNMGEGFLPAETLWRAAHIFCMNAGGAPHPDSEPTPEEMLGLTVGILRRRNNISRLNFARSIGCSVEELVALEAGLMPKNTMQKYLPAIAQEIGIDPTSLQPQKRRMKTA